MIRAPKVLIVEDDESIRCLLRDYLSSSLGVEVICASCVSEGKCRFTQNHVDLVICDQNMGDGVGTEMLRFIRERDQRIPFILYTGQLRSDLPEVGPLTWNYVHKPEVTKLLDLVGMQLGGLYGRK